MKHSAHTLDPYLDDNDFLELSDRAYRTFKTWWVTPQDYEEGYREKLLDYMEAEILDFVNSEAVDDFGYKYGQLFGNGYREVAERIVDFIKPKIFERL